MAYNTFKALALGSIGGATGIAHFDPDRSDEGGRYQEGVLPAAVAAKAEKRGLIEITGDATEKDYRAQVLGLSGNRGEAAVDRIKDLPESDTGVGGTSATATVATRNFPAGQGRVDSDGTIDPDAAPVDAGEPGPLDQSIAKLKDHLAGIDDVAELDRLRAAEVGGKSRDGALAAIDARKEEITGAA